MKYEIKTHYSYRCDSCKGVFEEKDKQKELYLTDDCWRRSFGETPSIDLSLDVCQKCFKDIRKAKTVQIKIGD